MDITLSKCDFHGTIDEIISSKSHAHRLLIASALSNEKTEIYCNSLSADIEATIKSLNSLGAIIKRNDNQIIVQPISTIKKQAVLDCGESGSTLRFMLPIAGALNSECEFIRDGNLATRPLSPLYEELVAHGMVISNPLSEKLLCKGKLKSGKYTIAGNISSQFITGLLFALPLLDGDSVIEITGELQSKSYIDMTLDALSKFSINIKIENNNFHIKGNQKFISPREIKTEADWSGATFWLVAGAMSQDGITCRGLSQNSFQGDRKVLDILREFGANIKIINDDITVKTGDLNGTLIDAADIPDAIPALSILAAASKGKTTITNTKRLRYKECDRVNAISKMLTVLGVVHEIYENSIEIFGNEKYFRGGIVDSFKDHRIAMSAAVASIYTDGNILIKDAECVDKSYPDFFDIFKKLSH